MAQNYMKFIRFYKVSIPMFPGVANLCFTMGFHCFAKVAKSHRGIVKILMVFDDSGGRCAQMSRNGIEYDRFL